MWLPFSALGIDGLANVSKVQDVVELLRMIHVAHAVEFAVISDTVKCRFDWIFLFRPWCRYCYECSFPVTSIFLDTHFAQLPHCAAGGFVTCVSLSPLSDRHFVHDRQGVARRAEAIKGHSETSLRILQ